MNSGLKKHEFITDFTSDTRTKKWEGSGEVAVGVNTRLLGLPVRAHLDTLAMDARSDFHGEMGYISRAPDEPHGAEIQRINNYIFFPTSTKSTIGLLINNLPS